MMLSFGEIVLIRMHFHQASGSKIRPAVVLLDSDDDDFVAAPVTSQLRLSPYDIALADWQAAGLNIASSVRIHKLTVLSKGDIVRHIGVLSGSDREAMGAILCGSFCSK